jgi:hypothetical protein
MGTYEPRIDGVYHIAVQQDTQQCLTVRPCYPQKSRKNPNETVVRNGVSVCWPDGVRFRD